MPKDSGAIMRRLHDIHREYGNNDRKPLGVFWERLLPSLQISPSVYTESGTWLVPEEVRITTGNEEKKAIPAFAALDMEIVHQDLDGYRNILTSRQVGVRPLSVGDIHRALGRMGMVGQVLSGDSSPLRSDLLRLFWDGIPPALQRAANEDRQEALKLLRQCTLAPAEDGRLWPCEFLYRADEDTRRIFVNLVRKGVSFLAEKDIPLLDRLCTQFVPRYAIAELGHLHSKGFDFQANWHKGHFDAVAVLKWFDINKKQLFEDDELPGRLARIPMFPSAEKLRPLSELWLPGSFSDPLRVADLVDMGRLAGLSDFLRSLGAKELTFPDYAERYVSKAFAPSSTVDLKAKRKLLNILTTRFGEIRENNRLKTKLARTNIVECTNGAFRQPNEAYFPCEEVRKVFGDSVHYVRLAENEQGRADLNRWLGVESNPRPHDVMLFVDKVTAIAPKRSSRQAIMTVLEIIGKTFPDVSGDEKKLYGFLKTKAWLPSEGDSDRWHKPDQLHAIYNKSLFESQARFLDGAPWDSARYQ